MSEATTLRRQRVIVLLDDPDYAQLAEVAQTETRTPDQQAQHIIRAALRRAQQRARQECDRASAA